jgi:hypothetical protein
VSKTTKRRNHDNQIGIAHKFFQLMKSSPEYNYLQYVLACAMKYNYLQYVVACAMKWYNMYIICIEINKHTDNREMLFNSFNWLPSNINIDVNPLTKGSDFLIYQENTTIFKHAFKQWNDIICI